MDPKLERWVGNGGSESSGVTAGASKADPCPRPQINRRNAGSQSSLGALGPGPWSAVPLRDCNPLAVPKHAREHSSSPSSPRDGAGALSARDFVIT